MAFTKLEDLRVGDLVEFNCYGYSYKGEITNVQLKHPNRRINVLRGFSARYAAEDGDDLNGYFSNPENIRKL